MVKKLLPVAILTLALVIGGCTTVHTTITSLTPKREYRNDTGLYQFEAALNSRQQTLRWDTIKASVMIGTDSYPMRMTSLMTNRWETLVPIPSGTSMVTYRFKFDFDYTAFGGPPKGNSKLSPVYKLQIMDHR
jgi:hypothetical protein